MRDATVSLQRVNELHPKIAKEVEDMINWIEKFKFPDGRVAIRVVQGLRTIEYQNLLYAQGRSRPGSIVTKAKGGSSFHNFGLAFDFAILYDKDKNGTFETLSWDLVKDMNLDGERDWMEVVKNFEAIGYNWGGDWHSIKDNPHLEKTFGYSVEALYQMYKDKKFITGTSYLNI